MEKLSLSQIGLYNAQRMSDDVVEKLFVVRQNLFELVLNKITAEPLDSISQNYLFIGQRGMGKSTLLKRIEVELRNKHSKGFIPLLFPEEQYNIDKLSDFWLNCLDAMADTLEIEKNKKDASAIDQIVRELEKVDKTEVDHLAFEKLLEFSKKMKRRPVLLVDNLGFIFKRLEQSDKHLLRAQLMKNGAPILVATNPVSIEETNEYGAPFYDWFSFYPLKKLSFEELKTILYNLARLTEQDNLINEINQHQARLQTLHQLTGGNPRTTVMLFKLIINGFTSDVNDDLEALLDEITPLYKARFEELPEKMQIIVDAIALAWHPVDLAKLRELTSLENQQLSPQLKRLADLGWIEKVETDQKSSSSYQISERFFSIWFLMRRSSRRQKLQLYYLSRFLETLYGETLPDLATQQQKNVEQSSSSSGKEDEDYSIELREAEGAYVKALEINRQDLSPNYNLVFLYRDKLNNPIKAKSIFENLKPEKGVEDSYYLNQSLFEVYENNLGIAAQSLNKALAVIDKELPANTQDDWWRFAAVVQQLKQTPWLLQCLEESGYYEKLAPFYYANKTLLAKDQKGYLGSLAAEIKLATEIVLERIKHFLDD